VVNRLNAAAVKAVKSPELRAKFESQGYTLVGNTPEEFAAWNARAYERVQQMVKAIRGAGVKFE
jgi:tripartite-type tricarboxylate transporter receptor subunit TctC